MNIEKQFYCALKTLYEDGQKVITAQNLADKIWPSAKRDNSNGQVMNTCSGLAGRLLRKYRGCLNLKNGLWEIFPEFFKF